MFKQWNLLVFLALCCFAARASTVTTSCRTNSSISTGDNISSSCSVLVNNVPYSATASLSTSASEISASVSSDGPGNNLANDGVLGMLYASAYFTVDETWLITGGTGSALLYFNFGGAYPYETLPPFLTALSAQPRGDPDGDSEANVISVPYINIQDGNITGVYAQPVPFTFGVPLSLVLNVNISADDGFIDGGWASAGLALGTQTYTIPNENTVPACFLNTCPPWEIHQSGSNFESATLVITAVNPSAAPEPSFGGPLLALLLALALWRYGPAIRLRFGALHFRNSRPIRSRTIGAR